MVSPCLFEKVVITFLLQELLRSLCIRSNVAIKQMTLPATVCWCPINLKGEQLWCDTNTNAQRHVWWMLDGKGGLLLVKGETTTSLSAELWQEPYLPIRMCHGKVCIPKHLCIKGRNMYVAYCGNRYISCNQDLVTTEA